MITQLLLYTSGCFHVVVSGGLMACLSRPLCPRTPRALFFCVVLRWLETLLYSKVFVFYRPLAGGVASQSEGG